ncbi:MAG: asparagine synthase-related protein [Solirubrobacterales bacterium]
MLAFRLDARDATSPWRPTPTGWIAGRNSVEPFRHPALEDFALLSDGRLLVVVRERCAGEPRPESGLRPCPGGLTRATRAAAAEVLKAMRKWPLHWSVLTLSLGGPGAGADLETSSWGTAPVFVLARGEELWGDWDPVRLRPLISEPGLDPQRAAHFVARADCGYSRTTMLPGLLMQTERSRLRWRPSRGTDGALTAEYPEPAPLPRPTALKAGADPAAAFWEILTSSLRRWLDGHHGGVAIEVSGGLDSASVAAAAAAVSGAPLHSCGISLAGPCRADQRRRRGLVVERFGLQDREVDILDHLPLAPGGCRATGGLTMPWEEYYYEAADAALAAAAASGADLILTGLGGDELCGWRPGDPPRATSRPPDERQGRWSGVPRFLSPAVLETLGDGAAALDPVPRPLAARSVPETLAIGSAMYMRRGLWAVHPLATPELVRFCGHLPATWRRRRRVQRAVLDRAGCPRAVSRPAQRDDFLPALAAAMRGPARALAGSLFSAPRLAALGFLDRERLLSEYAEWCASDDIDGATPFYAAAMIELLLASDRNPDGPSSEALPRRSFPVLRE